VTDETPKFDSDSAKEANFEGETLTDCDFERVTFKSAKFRGATFTGLAGFYGATFTGRADFDGATFTDAAVFYGTTFNKGASFVGAIFTKVAGFDNTTFTEGALFIGATFTSSAIFEGATFSEGTSFYNANFTEEANFAGATFTELANFDSVTFTGRANFAGATVNGEATFGGASFTKEANFVNAEMKGVTSFDGVSFISEPPRFFGAKLHEGTVWRDVIWPDPPKDAQEAGRFVDAYERLKLEMDRLKKHEDELDFFARELQCRRVLQGTRKGLPLAIYGALCDYGRSYIRPLLFLVITAFAGAVPFWVHFGGLVLRPLTYAGHAREALGLSIANTFGILGIRKDLIAASVLEALPWWLKVVATAQTGLGIVLLFLFGLGIRNRFRMK
jgi:uncharacterized protein YjbI with pentapeptide repeats